MAPNMKVFHRSTRISSVTFPLLGIKRPIIGINKQIRLKNFFMILIFNESDHTVLLQLYS